MKKVRSPLLLVAALFIALSPANAAEHYHYRHHRKHYVHHYVARVAPPVDSTPIVWVNLNSGIYHYEGERWYGNTENGEYLHEDQAIADGYRATENGQ